MKSGGLIVGSACFLMLCGIAAYHSFRSLSELNPNTKETRWQVIRMGPLAPKKLFTSVGWRHRNLALLWYSTGIAIGLIMAICSGGSTR